MTDRKRCVLATANPDKAREIRDVLSPLGWELVVARERGITEEIPETGSTLEANARQKALHVADRTGALSLADDTGLEVDALDGRPGVYSARYAGPGASYSDNCEKLLSEMSQVPLSHRRARFRTVIALAVPGTVLLEVEGSLEGRITRSAIGKGGFGYDPLFEVPHLQQTLAQLSVEEKNRISHRARALQALLENARNLID